MQLKLNHINTWPLTSPAWYRHFNKI